jgi:hypothetical protein
MKSDIYRKYFFTAIAHRFYFIWLQFSFLLACVVPGSEMEWRWRWSERQSNVLAKREGT